MSKKILAGIVLLKLGAAFTLIVGANPSTGLRQAQSGSSGQAFVFAQSDPSHSLRTGLSSHEQGIAYRMRGDYEAAIEAFSEEIRRNPKAAGSYYELALVYEDLGKSLQKAGQHSKSQDSYFKAYSAWRDYLKLKPDEMWAARARGHIDRLKSAINFEGPVFREARIDDLFPSIKNSYPFDPVGYVVVENRGAEEVRNVKVFLEAKKYMDFPAETKEVEVLDVGDSIRLDLHATFNDQIMEVTGNTQFQVSLKMSYHDGAKKVETGPKPYTITLYNRNAMTWAPSDKLASFVTYIEPTVKLFAGNVVQMYRDEDVSYIHERVLKAMRIFHALGSYGMTYVEDPKTPFKSSSENPHAIDYIQFPLDTITRKVGDCDDGVVLYDAMLESIGIPTALVDFPGHVYPMFDTGVPMSEAYRITTDTELVIPYKGTIWVPVETTLWRKSFTEAWRNAAYRFQRTSRSDVKVIEMAEAWKKYQPAPLLGSKLEIGLPPKAEIDRLLAEDFRRQHDEKVDYIVKNNPDLVKARDDDYQSHNRLGAIFGKSMLYDEAISEFKKALKAKGDYLEARMNLGYAYYLKRAYADAIDEFSRIDSEKVKPDERRARVHFNLGVVYYRNGERERAAREWEMASKLVSSYKARAESVMLGGSGEKAAEGETALPEMDVMWEE
jgi:tetratricopeptide (TPR) repeat protein